MHVKKLHSWMHFLISNTRIPGSWVNYPNSAKFHSSLLRNNTNWLLECACVSKKLHIWMHFLISRTRIPGTWVYYSNSAKLLEHFLLHEFHSSLLRIVTLTLIYQCWEFFLRFLAGWFYVSWGCSRWFLLWAIENQDSTGEHSLYLATFQSSSFSDIHILLPSYVCICVCMFPVVIFNWTFARPGLMV